MRLIDTNKIQLVPYLVADPPPYAILSHTWREDELIYSELMNGYGMDKKGYKKIKYLCDLARKDNLEYAWIDTACIDKTNSAELSEAINSMFKWYWFSTVCYVYVDDIDHANQIGNSRWITRGQCSRYRMWKFIY